MFNLSSVDIALADMTTYSDRLTDYYYKLFKRANETKAEEFAAFRKFSVNTVKECGIFYVGDMSELLLPEYIDEVSSFGVISPANNMPIFNNRWVIPIKSPDGKIQNFVGYSPSADERYIYGTAKYYQRRETLWGLENLKLAYDLGYAFVTEGITDAIRLRDMGYKNSFARCGTHSSKFIDKQLNRCRHGIIWVPDRDDAGLRAAKGWKCNRSATLYISFKYKDIDELCRESIENQDWAKEYLDACADWIKSDVHNGKASLNEKITML